MLRPTPAATKLTLPCPTVPSVIEIAIGVSVWAGRAFRLSGGASALLSCLLVPRLAGLGSAAFELARMARYDRIVGWVWRLLRCYAYERSGRSHVTY